VAGLAATPALRGQGRVVATFELNGQTRSVAETNLALELALHFRLRAEGKEAIQFLVDAALVEIEAHKQGVSTSPGEVDSALATLKQQFKESGRDLEEMLRNRGYSLADYRREVATGLTLRKLTQKALGREQVDGAMQELWREDARKRHDVLTDPDKLPPGVVARVADRSIGLLTLGELLQRTQGVAAKEERIRKIIARQWIQAEADAAGLSITDQDVDREIEARKAEVNSDPRYKGVPFEKLLESLGHTLTTLRSSPDFRAQILLRKLVEQEHPHAALVERLVAERDSVIAQHGAARKLEMILLRAAETPTEFVKRTFPEAEEEMAKLYRGIQEGAPFGTVARLNSEEPASKARDGAIGWLHRADTRLPAAVMEAAFEAPVDGMTPIVTTEEGVFLVRVVDVEPPPGDDVLLKRMRAALLDERAADIYRRAKIRYGDNR